MLIIFDCDGVLIDSEVIFCSVDADALTSVGYPTQATEIARRFAGIPHRDAWEILCRRQDFNSRPAGWIGSGRSANVGLNPSSVQSRTLPGP